MTITHATAVTADPDGHWQAYCLHCGPIATEESVAVAQTRAEVHADYHQHKAQVR